MRTRFTNREVRVVAEIIYKLKMDDSFWLNEDMEIGEDYFYDRETDERMTLEEGLRILYEAIAYPLVHERIGYGDSKTFVNLLREFEIGDELYYDWLMDEDENKQR